MNIQHRSGETKGEFFLEKNGDIKANLTYSKAGESLIILDHTDVSDELKGKNVGKLLVEHAVTYARENELEVIPLCPFAASVFKKNKSLQDVLKKQ
ncbi:MAG: GNAT family N-acetyltransferase [Balneolales bacterium]